jgi:hypothetical protein
MLSITRTFDARVGQGVRQLTRDCRPSRRGVVASCGYVGISGTKMSTIMILAGGLMSAWGAKAAVTVEARRSVVFTGPRGPLLMLLTQVGGAALLIVGIITLFT